MLHNSGILLRVRIEVFIYQVEDSMPSRFKQRWCPADRVFVSWASSRSLAHLWVIHGFNRAVISRAQRREVDEDIHLRVLPHGICHVLVDRDQDFFVAPVELLPVVTTMEEKVKEP